MMIFKWRTNPATQEREAMMMGRTSMYKVAFVAPNQLRTSALPNENYVARVQFFENAYTAKRASMAECEAWATTKLNQLIDDLEIME